jgi:hypothetical protein
VCFCRKSTDLSWEGDEPSSAVAEEVAPPAEESTPATQAVTDEGEGVTTSPEVALEVAIRSPEIQDAEPIRSAPITEATASSRGGIELLANDPVEPATVAKHLEAIR